MAYEDESVFVQLASMRAEKAFGLCATLKSAWHTPAVPCASSKNCAQLSWRPSQSGQSKTQCRPLPNAPLGQYLQLHQCLSTTAFPKRPCSTGNKCGRILKRNSASRCSTYGTHHWPPPGPHGDSFTELGDRFSLTTFKEAPEVPLAGVECEIFA